MPCTAVCTPTRDNADLYDAFGNYLGGDLDSGSESDASEEQQQQQEQQRDSRAYDEDMQEPLEGLDGDEGMEVDGEWAGHRGYSGMDRRRLGALRCGASAASICA